MTDPMKTMDKATAASILSVPQNASVHDIEDAYARLTAILGDDESSAGRRHILDMARAVMINDSFDVIDADGNNYFEQLSDDVKKNMPGIESRLGITPDYTFTEVNAE